MLLWFSNGKPISYDGGREKISLYIHFVLEHIIYTKTVLHKNCDTIP